MFRLANEYARTIVYHSVSVDHKIIVRGSSHVMNQRKTRGLSFLTPFRDVHAPLWLLKDGPRWSTKDFLVDAEARGMSTDPEGDYGTEG